MAPSGFKIGEEQSGLPEPGLHWAPFDLQASPGVLQASLPTAQALETGVQSLSPNWPWPARSNAYRQQAAPGPVPQAGGPLPDAACPARAHALSCANTIRGKLCQASCLLQA